MHLHLADPKYSSWSFRPWLLMKMMGIDFEVTWHAYLHDLVTQRKQWRQFSPTSKVPVLMDGDLCIWDSMAICQYLAERYPQIYPEDQAARAWVYSAAAEMHSGFMALRNDCGFRVTPAPQPVQVSAELAMELERIDALWVQGLQAFGGAFLAGGSFSVADAFYAPVVLRIYFYGLQDYFSVQAQSYMDHILALPAVREWLALCE